MLGTTLVIGDAHVQHGQDLRRFRALGKYILDEKPSAIIIMGDFLDMQALSAWDKNKRLKMEGMRYRNEIIAGNKALDLMLGPYIQRNEELAKQKHRRYRPELVYIEGNHEFRQGRYIEEHPELQGQLDYEQELGVKDRGFIHVPYRDYYFHQGIGFTHIPHGGNGKPVSGSIGNQMSKALGMHNQPVIYGHVHKLYLAGEARLGGTERYNQVLSVGCFFEHTDEYVQGAQVNYWRGIILLTHTGLSEFDIQTLSLRRLLEDYGEWDYFKD